MATYTKPTFHATLFWKWKTYSVTQSAFLKFFLFLTVFFTTTSFDYRGPENPTKTKARTGLNKNIYAGGDFSLDFVASAPFTYNHTTGGGAFDDRTIGKTNDVVESLEGGDFKCGDIVTYLTKVKVAADAEAGPQTIQLNYSFLANTTGQSGAAHTDIVAVSINDASTIYGADGTTVIGEGTGGSDLGNHESGTVKSTATLSNEHIEGTVFVGHATLEGTVTVTGLEPGETVIVRVDVRIECQPGSSPTGNLQGAIPSAKLTAPGTGTINVGNQTVPFKKIGELQSVECSITPRDAVCTGTTNPYTATSTQAGSTFQWTISGNGTFVGGGTTFSETPAGTTSTVSVVAGVAGSYTLGITISKAGFATTNCSQQITVNATPQPLGVKNLEFCLTAGAIVQLLDAITSGTPIFTDAGGTPLPVQPSTQSLGTVGTFTFYAIQESLGGCRSTVAQFTIKVNPNPDAPGVKNTEFCVTPNVNTALSNNITSGTAIFTDASGTPLPVQPTEQSLATAGTFTFYAIQQVGDCKSGVAQFTIKVNPNPDAPGVKNTEFCVTPNVNTALSNNITSGTAIFTDAGGTPLPVQPTEQSLATAGTFTFYAIQQVGDCKSGVASFTIKVNPNPDAPGVKNTEFCVTPNVNTALSNNITSGTAIFTDAGGTPLPVQPTEQSLATAGTFTFYAIQQVGDCKSGVAQFTIKVNPNPDAPGVKNTEFCVTPNVNTALSNNITSGTAIFTNASGTPLNPQPTTQSLATAGTFTFYAIQQAGDCKSGVAQFTIKVNSNPDAPGVKNTEFCVTPNVNTALSNNITSGTAIFTDAGGTPLPVQPTEQSLATAGTFTFYAIQQVGDCKSGVASFTIKVNPNPDAPGVKNTEFCVTPNVNTALSNNITSGTAIFTDAGGTPLPVQPTEQSLATAGTFTFYAIQQVGDCKSGVASFTIKVNPNPDAPGVKNTEFCVTPNVNTALSNNITSGTAIFTDAGGTPLPVQPTEQSLATAGTFTFYAIQQVGDCKSGVASFTIKVNSNPDAPGVKNTEFCVTPNVNTALSNNITSGTAIFTDAGGTPLSPQPTTQSLATAGTFTFYAIQQAGDCKSGVASFTIKVENCFEGCTPGYWKNHPGAWSTTGYSPDDKLTDVFVASGSYSLGNATLMDALSFKGGNGVQGAVTNLLRAAVAALLNAASSDVDYPRTTQQVIDDVNAALSSGSRSVMLALAKELDEDNNLGCPLNNSYETRASINSRSAVQDVKVTELTVLASPNPYSSKVRFTIQSPKAGKAVLEVYNLMGQKVGVPFEGQLHVNETRNVEFTVPVNHTSGLVYRLRLNGKQVSGKLVSIRQ